MKTIPEEFSPLESVTSQTVEGAAAFYLNHRSQPLRGHACHEDSPICQLRITGRLAWPVAKPRSLLGVA